MSLDVIICRNISFVGCILIVAGYRVKQDFAFIIHSVTVDKKMYFVVNFVHSHLAICWFIGVIGLLYRPLSIFRSRELIRYLAIDVMRWLPLVCKIYGSKQKYFFTNAYVRSLLELSISFLHCCVNILTIDSLNKSMNLFVSPIFCDSQI